MRKDIAIFLIVGALSGADSLPLMAQTSRPAPTKPAPTNAAPNSSPSSDVYFINRAKNLARQAAISANGGLEKYRPDPRMYGPAIQTDYVRNKDNSITFKFLGSAPGASTPSFETVARVLASGVVNLEYNGVLRPITGSGTQPGLSTPIPPVSTAVSGSTSPTSSASTPSGASTGSVLPVSSAQSPSGSITEVPPGTKAVAWVDQDAFVSRSQNLARQAAIKANGGLAAYRPEPLMYGPSAKAPFVKNADGSLTFTFKGGNPDGGAMTVESVVTVNSANNVTVQYNGPVRSPR
jgi:hypothetical protein